ncbi:hypothetical protein RvY_16898 [Ramazzottius varieornatus]|uniref:UDP-glycosyltransferases domain-containing protein n=1 Tax=Ramazzottius varieornatus TaxID=947166 RepID=A0A1D1W4C1_RAMVA|nr:hypothetical protein RvY_16898 [Ramazzottius varieornatus]
MLPQPQQLKELSQALVRLNQPVVWSLRTDYHIHLSEELMSLAQFDLEASVATDKRLLVVSWVPQKMVLSHESIGLFVSHCGWNSTVEALSEGKPIVCWSQFGDQLVNAELVERNKAGVIIRDAHLSSGRVVLEDEILQMIEMAQTKGNGALTVKEKLRLAWKTGGSSSSSFQSLTQLIDSYQ